MSELSQLSPSEDASDLSLLRNSVARLSGKIRLVQDTIQNLTQDRLQLEAKIGDAQKRIQHILSRLPEQSDGRQLNLLGEAIPPINPEDDNEPTTH